MPTLIVCCFVMVAAIQSFFTGVILRVIYQKNRREFELNLYNAVNEFNKKKNDIN